MRLDVDRLHDPDALRASDPRRGHGRAGATWVPALCPPSHRSDRAHRTGRGVRRRSHEDTSPVVRGRLIVNGRRPSSPTGTSLTSSPCSRPWIPRVGGRHHRVPRGDRKLDGLQTGPPMNKLGQKGASTVELNFQDCRIPPTGGSGRRGTVTLCCFDRSFGPGSARRPRESGSPGRSTPPSELPRRDLLSAQGGRPGPAVRARRAERRDLAGRAMFATCAS